MIKEKDYPYFAKPEGKEKFKQFVKDFKITAATTLPRNKTLEFFKERLYMNTNLYPDALDHVSFWRSENLRDFKTTYYAVSQSYNKKEDVIKTLQNNKYLAKIAYLYGFKITIYDNEKYNWHNSNMTFVLIRLNNPDDPFYEPEYPPLKIESGN